MSKNFFVTTPIFYVNGDPHIGSCYAILAADMIARFHRLMKCDVKFLTGTDEHGQKIEQSAKKADKDCQQFVDEVSQKFREMREFMDFSTDYFSAINDNFIRTTNPVHKKVVQDIWRLMVKNDWIYEGKYTGWYCVSDEAYYTEDELVKDETGKFFTEIGKEVEWREEESYFFKLSEFQNILLELYKRKPEFIQPDDKRNEIIAFVSGLSIKDFEEGKAPKTDYLQDISVTRNNFDWGIRIPCDLKGKELLDEKFEWKNDLIQKEKHVIYVWLDALFNYITALGGLNSDEYNKYWKDGKVVHVIGKEISRFHSVYWPAFLIACKYKEDELKNKKIDEKLIDEIYEILPKTVLVHGWWTAEGRKISKSFGNVIIPKEEIERLKTTYNISEELAKDYLRYYLISSIPFGNDGDYSKARFTEKINAELANNIGNLFQRVLSMIYKNFDGKIPTAEKFESSDKKILNLINKDKINLLTDLIENFKFDQYINEIILFGNELNNYIEEQKPWTLKENKERLGTVLYVLAENVRKIAILMQAICPNASKNIIKQMNLDKLYSIDGDYIYFDNLEKNFKNNWKIEEPIGIFLRLKE